MSFLVAILRTTYYILPFEECIRRERQTNTFHIVFLYSDRWFLTLFPQRFQNNSSEPNVVICNVRQQGDLLPFMVYPWTPFERECGARGYKVGI